MCYTYNQGRISVYSDCKFYNKAAIDGTQVVNCTVNDEPWVIKIIQDGRGKKK